jgi:hypothetical protein
MLLPEKLNDRYLVLDSCGPYGTPSAPVKLSRDAASHPLRMRIVDPKHFSKYKPTTPWSDPGSQWPSMYAYMNGCCKAIQAELLTGGTKLEYYEFLLPVTIMGKVYKPQKKR